jgi:hypothetical protein
VVEEAIYQTQAQSSVLVGVPDVAIQSIQTRSEVSLAVESSLDITVAEPIVVNLPLPEVLRQGYLEIQDVATSEVVTVIEVLSPVNKRPGDGRRVYEAKRQTLLSSATNLVEIDLLRRWPALVQLPQHLETHYRILVSANPERPQARLYGFNIQNPLPAFPLPMPTGESEPIVNLQSLLGNIYDQSGYDLVVDYQVDPLPPLSEQDSQWLSDWLKEKGLR